MAETREETAERLAPLAATLVARVRAEPVDQLRHELLTGLSERDRDGLIMLLAAAGDPNMHPDVWWSWVRHRDVARKPRPADEEENPEADDLTSAEIDALVLSGRPVPQIAAETGLSETAVFSRRRRLRAAAGEPAAERGRPRAAATRDAAAGGAGEAA